MKTKNSRANFSSYTIVKSPNKKHARKWDGEGTFLCEPSDSCLRYSTLRHTGHFHLCGPFWVYPRCPIRPVPHLNEAAAVMPPIRAVQPMFYASLAASLFAAFLAMFCKQWYPRTVVVLLQAKAMTDGRNPTNLFRRYFHSPCCYSGNALTQYLWAISLTAVGGASTFMSPLVASYAPPSPNPYHIHSPLVVVLRHILLVSTPILSITPKSMCAFCVGLEVS